MSSGMKISWEKRMVRLGELKFFDSNPRILTAAQYGRIKESLDTFGYAGPILADPGLTILDGHARTQVLLDTYGPSAIVEVWVSSRPLSCDEHYSLIMAFNGQASGEWNWDILSSWNPDILVQWGLDREAIDKNYREIVNIQNFLESEKMPDEKAVDLGKKYSVVLMDPPWTFETRSDKGKGRSPENHYPVLTLEDMKGLRVLDILEPDAVLFLWVTSPVLEQAFDLVKAWNTRAVTRNMELTYRTTGFYWVKMNKSWKEVIVSQVQEDPDSLDINSVLSMGNGYYTRSNAEMCLIFARGKVTVSAHDVKNTYLSERERHSKKPDAIYSMIERLYPDGNRLEVFARQSWPGWDAIGNEIDGRDIRDIL